MNTYRSLSAKGFLAVSFFSIASLAGLAGCSDDISPPVGSDASTATDGSTHFDAALGDAGSRGDSGGGSDNARCTVASDCRLYSNTCDTCSCIPLSKDQVDPVCTGTPTSCIVDPCQNKQVGCVGGFCVLQ